MRVEVACDLEIQLEEHVFSLKTHPQESDHLQFVVPSLAAGFYLLRQLGRGELRSFLGQLEAWGCFEHLVLDLVYQNQTLASRSLCSYRGLDALWFLSRQWNRLRG